MLDFFKNIITTENFAENYDSQKQLQLATCALFIEVANADDDFSKVENEFIKKIIKEKFGLEDGLVNELLEESRLKTEKSISLYEFTKTINQFFNKKEKIEIVKNLWKLVFSDGVMDKYEEHFMRTISNNLHLPHSEMIATKLEAKEEAKN
ncbi:MAG: TerB family tellurite resistance protein [Bacteroidetes bacterium]|nr:TerB family tellurite resistance protein [Bacteroidota bacterium]MBU1799627.1 TerB family tellurite resistance protein [Bacteroidota bacterium]